MFQWNTTRELTVFITSDEAAFPVEEQAIVSAPASIALATAMELARSFKEAVGLSPSSFTQSFPSPS